MILKRLKLENFRGYSNIEIPFDEDFNIIIGKNDVGKSTILEALEIFFNNEVVKIEYEDLYVHNAEKKISIGVVFEIDKDEEYLVDSSFKTNLEDEYLLNKDGDLEIHKVWDCTKGKITATSLTTILKANYIADYKEEPLVTLKITQLKKILEEKKSEIADYDSVKKDTSSSIRRAIYSTSKDKEKVNISILMKAEDSKKIYESISKEFPMFFLFQSDRANRDSDKEVQDPLKAITRKAIEEVEEQLEEVKNIIQTKALEIGQQTLDKLGEMSPEIAKVLKPNIQNKPWDSLFSFSFEGDEGIPMNKRGSGVRRLIILNYFRAEAERKNADGRAVIYAIEEPETAQHPNHQIMLMNALLELGQQEKRQVIITTHTPEIAKMVSEGNLILIKNVEGNPVIVEGENKLLEISNTLGLLPYYGKLVICVEGECDVSFLKNINQGIEEFKEIIDLVEEKISLIPMIGSNLKNWINKNYLEDSNVVEYHIYDRDDNDQYQKSVKKLNARGDKSAARLTERREMENYIHHSLIEAEFGIDLTANISSWEVEDVPTLVLDKTKREKKEIDIKRIINGKLAQDMTKEHLEEMGTYKEVESWFLGIRELYQSC